MHWSVNAYKKNFEIGIQIIAEKGTISIGGENLNEVKYMHMESPVEFPSYKRENWSNHNELYDHLIETMKANGNGFPDAYDGLKAVETIEKIYKATS